MEQGRDGCWNWIGHRDRDGYGIVHQGTKRMRAHRVAWSMRHEPLLPCVHLLHTCDNRACVNPAHLKVGTHAENMRERNERGRCKVPVRANGSWTGEIRHAHR